MKKQFTLQPLHQQVAQSLREHILSLPAGKKLPSDRDLARELNVSVPTVREAMTTFAHEGLVERRAGRGTIVRHHDDKRHIGVLLDLDFALPEISFFWRRAVQQVRRGLREHGYRTRLYAGESRPGEQAPGRLCLDLLEELDEGRLCGVVSVWSANVPELQDRLRQSQIPCVGAVPQFDASVRIDYPQAMRQAAGQFLQAGRCKLALIGWSPGSDERWIRDQFVEPFSSELAKHGVRLNDHWVRGDVHPTLGGAGWSHFREIWTISADKPDGLLVVDDMLFRSAATAIQELGIRAPEQLMVVTHANKGEGYRYPFPVLRMEADPNAYAQKLVERMAALLLGQSPAQPHVLLPLQFVATESASVNIVGAKETTSVTHEGELPS